LAIITTRSSAWIAHQLPRDPLHLFDANIFYPRTLTLAYSDAILFPALAAAPIIWAGANTVVVYNLLLLGSFVAAATAMYALVRELTGSPQAAWIGGTAFAFQAFRFGHYSQLELFMSWPIPLAFLAMHRLAERGRLRHAVWLAIAVALQMWSCVYYAVFLATALVVAAPFLFWRRERAEMFLLLRRAGAAAAIAGALIAPYAAVYVAAGRSIGTRSAQEVRDWSATLADYATVPPENFVYGSALGRGYAIEHALFPGLAVLIAALVGLVPPLDRRRAAYAVLLVAAFDWSLGFNGISYAGIYRLVWIFQAIRVPARMFVIVSLALSVLAGEGMRRILARVGSEGRRRLLTISVMALVLLETATVPNLTGAPQIPTSIYSWLAAQTPCIVAEWPMPRAASVGITHEPVYMFYSMRHWQRLVNGYSGFYPLSYVQLLDNTASFPSADAIAYFRRVPVTYIVLHSEFDPAGYVDLRNALAHRPEVELVATERQGAHELALYRLLPAPSPDQKRQP
jgi:hypothetical protein